MILCQSPELGDWLVCAIVPSSKGSILKRHMTNRTEVEWNKVGRIWVECACQGGPPPRHHAEKEQLKANRKGSASVFLRARLARLMNLPSPLCQEGKTSTPPETATHFPQPSRGPGGAGMARQTNPSHPAFCFIGLL